MLGNLTTDDIVNFIVISIIARAFSEVLSDGTKRILKLVFIRTKKDLIIWTHYKSHGAKQGHTPKTPVECQDGDCSTV